MYADDVDSMRKDYERLQETVGSNPGDCFTIENAYMAYFNPEIVQRNLDYSRKIVAGVESTVVGN